MSNPLLAQLLEMGFSQPRSEKALRSVKNPNVETLIQWLSEHEDEPEASSVELEETGEENKAPDDATTASSESVGEARSYKCNVCEKLFRNTNEMEYHAAKTEHTDFAESTEEKRQLTEEEKKAAAADLQRRIAARKAAREAGEAAEALEREKARRKEGRGMANLKQEMADKDMRELAAERKRQKEQDKLAKQRVLDQIAQDKLERAAAKSGVPAPIAPSAAPTKVEPPPPRSYDNCRLQIRLLDGSALTHVFQAKETLAAVRLFIKLNRTDNSTNDFHLMTNFPRHVYSEEEMEAPLDQLGLVPAAVLVLTPKP